MELELPQMLILFACVFLGGLVDSIAGGGGLITLPAYYAVGIPAHMALGTNKFANSIGTLTALLRFLKEGQINIKVALVAALGALVGSPLGAQLAMALDEKYLNYILLVAVPVIAVLVMRKKDFGRERQEEMPLLRSVLLAAMVGFGTGMYDGFFGPGAGTFMTLLFNSVLGLGIIKACGTTKVVNLASNVGALITYGMNGNVLVGIGIKCTIFAILGSWVGSGLALKNGAKIVRPIMIVAMLLLLLKIASDMFLG